MKHLKHKQKCGCITLQFKPISMCGRHAQELITQVDQLRTTIAELRNPPAPPEQPDTFTDRAIYRDYKKIMAMRCADCGSPPEPEWAEATMQRGMKIYLCVALHCPNGTHDITESNNHD